MITPKDIHSKDFKKALRGYDMDDVDQFLDLIIKDMENLYKENASLKEECDKAVKKLDQYNEMETNLNRALILAEKTAEKVKTEALLEQENILAEAREKAAAILNKAEEDAKSFNIINIELIEKAENFKNNLISIFERQISSLKEFDRIEDILDFKEELLQRAQQNPEHTQNEESLLTQEESSLEADFSLEYEEIEEKLLDEEEEEFKNKVFRFLEK